MLPPLERRAAVDAVPMIEPPGYGLSLLVICIAGPEYLVARNTLSGVSLVG